MPCLRAYHANWMNYIFQCGFDINRDFLVDIRILSRLLICYDLTLNRHYTAAGNGNPLTLVKSNNVKAQSICELKSFIRRRVYPLKIYYIHQPAYYFCFHINRWHFYHGILDYTGVYYIQIFVKRRFIIC